MCRSRVFSSSSWARRSFSRSRAVGSASGAQPTSGIAASIGELDSSAHCDDTISAGGDEVNHTSASRVCGEGVEILAELER